MRVQGRTGTKWLYSDYFMGGCGKGFSRHFLLLCGKLQYKEQKSLVLPATIALFTSRMKSVHAKILIFWIVVDNIHLEFVVFTAITSLSPYGLYTIM